MMFTISASIAIEVGFQLPTCYPLPVQIRCHLETSGGHAALPGISAMQMHSDLDLLI